MTTTAESVPTRTVAGRIATSRGLWTMVVALVLLALAGLLFASTSMSKGALQGMLPFASVLAIVALGQTLVIQQGGFDLSVPGSVSIVVVISTHHPEGDNGKLLPALLMALGVAIAAGLVNGTLIGRLRLNPIVATLGTNALLYAGVLGISAGSPRRTTSLLASIAGGVSLGIPNAVFFAVAAVAITTVAVKSTVVGRRFEAVGANPRAGRATGLKVNRHSTAAYVWAQVLYWLGAVLLAGIIVQPTAFQGDAYLLPSVAAVVLGGTSLLGGKGNIVATALAALFLTQLQQFVLALGVNFAIQTLVQAAALALGVGLYTVDWAALSQRLRPSRLPTPTPVT
ncbi:MAG TPA: ABC transporter permease [Micromonosporaceae bacterium]|nr:ABC transporter permease [Micromonosporaceae bacterium]